ncbi:MAG: ABC transporter ATP-binding protein [Acidimicrobiales bacterium]|jgi:ABC-2 type transport system ATP-binding protein/ribosome-dependent ATPase
MTATLARTAEVSRRFGNFTAVHSVSLAVQRAEVVGLLGANGAGKTTLIRLLLGLVRPSGGEVELLGRAPSVATRRRVGYVPQSLGLYVDLTAGENWDFTAAAFSSPRLPLPALVASVRDELVGALPLGTQRRVAYEVAMAHKPELLVLDEPTSGVGPLARARLWQEIRETADAGAGVLVTTHNMEEAEECDRLVVMVDGEIAASGTVAEVVGGRTVLEVRCDDWQRAFTTLDAAGLEVQAHGAVLRVDAPAWRITELLAGEDLDPNVSVAPANLEEAFIAVVSPPYRP